jgi:hypothetical protein
MDSLCTYVPIYFKISSGSIPSAIWSFVNPSRSYTGGTTLTSSFSLLLGLSGSLAKNMGSDDGVLPSSVSTDVTFKKAVRLKELTRLTGVTNANEHVTADAITNAVNFILVELEIRDCIVLK